MRRGWPTVAVLTCGLLAGPTVGGGGFWVQFEDHTSIRLNPHIPSDDTYGKNDTEEKDYAWGDVDMDGDIDLVVVRKLVGDNSIGKRNRLFLNEDGVLMDRTDQYATNTDDGGQGFNDLTADRDVALVDVNGDGWLDIVTAVAGAYSGGPKTITHPRVYINLKNDGGGNWLGFRYEEARIPQLVLTPNFSAVAYGDLTGDVRPDLYFTDYTNDLEDRLLVNNGDGSFTDATSVRFSGNTAFLTSTFAPHAVIADLNGDGRNDIVKSDAQGPYAIKIAYNSFAQAGPGFFTASLTEDICSCTDYFVAVGDLNNDGKLDIVEGDDSDDRYFLNQGNGPDDMADWVSFLLPNSNSGFDNNIVIVDLDKDGFNDILIADVDVQGLGCGDRLDIHHNLGNPPNVTFQEDVGNLPSQVGGPLRGTHDVAVFDIDGDTWLDLVIGTCNGTTVWINQPLIGIAFGYPSGLPQLGAQDGFTVVHVELTPTGDSLDLDSPTLHVSINGGAFNDIPMTDEGAGIFSANLPAAACLDDLSFYLSAALSGGLSFTDPPSAPGSTYSAVVADGIQLALLDEIEGDVSGWTVVNDPSLVTGAWEQADPNGTISGGNLAAPDDDATPAPGVQAFVTENGPPGGAAANNDVDGGPTRLISPPVDLDGTDGIVTYARWFFSETGTPDVLTVEVSNDGANWVLVDTVSSTDSEWQQSSFMVGDFVTPTATVQVRFSVSDEIGAGGSITEAGIDDFQVEEFVCGQPCPSDINGDGNINVLDLIDLLLCFGQPVTTPCDTGQDVNGDGDVNVLDLIELLLAFGQACP